MEERKYLIPGKGMIVRDPRTKIALPEEGMVVDWIGPIGRYWRRRVNEGSCFIGKKPILKKENFNRLKKKVTEEIENGNII